MVFSANQTVLIKNEVSSDQKTFKIGIHSFSARRSVLKRIRVKIGRQVRLLCPLGKAFNGLPLSLSG